MLAVFISNTYWTFWDVFFLMFFFIPCFMVWGYAIFDDFTRRDLSGWGKAAWLVAIVILPFIGTMLYLIFRPWNEEAGYYGGRPYTTT